MSNHVTELARGDITAADELCVELIKAADMPAMIRITWPPQPTVVQPARFTDTASFIVRLFARASTELTRIRARRL